MHFLTLVPELHPLHTTPSTTSCTTIDALYPSPQGSHDTPFLTLLPTAGIPWRHPTSRDQPTQNGPLTTATAAAAANKAPNTTATPPQQPNSKILALVESSLQAATAAAASKGAEKMEPTRPDRTAASKFLRTPFKKLRRALGFPPRGLLGAGAGGST